MQQSVCHVWFFLRTHICKVKIFAPPPVPMSPQLHIFDTVYTIKYTMYLRTVGFQILGQFFEININWVVY